MIETNGATTLPAEETAEVLRLTDAQRARLALYARQVEQAQAQLADAFTNILIGRGVDLDRVEARLSSDGAVALLRARGAPAAEGA